MQIELFIPYISNADDRFCRWGDGVGGAAVDECGDRGDGDYAAFGCEDDV